MGIEHDEKKSKVFSSMYGEVALVVVVVVTFILLRTGMHRQYCLLVRKT